LIEFKFKRVKFQIKQCILHDSETGIAGGWVRKGAWQAQSGARAHNGSLKAYQRSAGSPWLEGQRKPFSSWKLSGS